MDEPDIIFDHNFIRRGIGILGFLLPIVIVVGGCLLFQIELPPTLSDYYHTKMHPFFVGLFAMVGLSVYAYRGYNSLERSAGFVVLVTAFMVGIFGPPLDSETWDGTGRIPAYTVDGHIHYAGAVSFFFIFWFFVWSFGEPRGERLKRLNAARSKDGNGEYKRSREKEKRDMVYAWCFWIMAALGVVGFLCTAIWRTDLPIVLLAETFIMWAFSLAWITKGQWIFPDNPKSNETINRR